MAGTRQRLPDRRARRAAVRADAGARAQRCARATSACSPTACCCCPRPPTRRTWPTCASSTPTARRPSCRATARARRSCTCAAAAGPTRTASRSTPPPARSARRSPGRTPAAWTWGRRSLRSEDFPGGPPDGRGDGRAPAAATWRFQHVSIGNPQCAIHVDSLAELEALDLPAIGPPIEADAQLPQPHERLLVRRARAGDGPPARIRARIFERGRGGDAVLGHRRDRRRGRLRARRTASAPATPGAAR